MFSQYLIFGNFVLRNCVPSVHWYPEKASTYSIVLKINDYLLLPMVLLLNYPSFVSSKVFLSYWLIFKQLKTYYTFDTIIIFTARLNGKLLYDFNSLWTSTQSNLCKVCTVVNFFIQPWFLLRFFWFLYFFTNTSIQFFQYQETLSVFSFLFISSYEKLNHFNIVFHIMICIAQHFPSVHIICIPLCNINVMIYW